MPILRNREVTLKVSHENVMQIFESALSSVIKAFLKFHRSRFDGMDVISEQQSICIFE